MPGGGGGHAASKPKIRGEKEAGEQTDLSNPLSPQSGNQACAFCEFGSRLPTSGLGVATCLPPPSLPPGSVGGIYLFIYLSMCCSGFGGFVQRRGSGWPFVLAAVGKYGR